MAKVHSCYTRSSDDLRVEHWTTSQAETIFQNMNRKDDRPRMLPPTRPNIRRTKDSIALPKKKRVSLQTAVTNYIQDWVESEERVLAL